MSGPESDGRAQTAGLGRSAFCCGTRSAQSVQELGEERGGRWCRCRSSSPQSWPVKETLRCFSETADQTAGPAADLQVHLEPKSCPPHTEPKDPNLPQLEHQNPCRSTGPPVQEDPVDTLCHRWPSSKVLQGKPARQRFHIPAPPYIKSPPGTLDPECGPLSFSFPSPWVAPFIIK